MKTLKISGNFKRLISIHIMISTDSSLQLNSGITTESKCHLVVIQPTPFCNINCRYCYLPNRLSTKKISQSTIKKIIESLFIEDLLTDETDVLWHASEPMVMPISFYKESFDIIDLVNKGRFPLKQSLQTNATLITEEWCNFIKERGIEIGVSLDGPKHIHDHCRIDRKGEGTFNRAFHGIQLLKKYDIPFHAIAVVTDYSIDHVDEIFDFFVANDILDIGFNAEEVTGVNTVSSLSGVQHLERCRQFFSRLIQLQIRSSVPVSIREFTYMSQNLMLDRSPLNSAVNTPFKILNFDTEGNFSTFCPELLTMSHHRFDNFTYGNINKQNIRSLVNDTNFLRIYAEIQEGVNACATSCEYFQLCGGGSPSSKISENGTFASTETSFCKLKIKTIADIVAEELEKILVQD